MDKVKIGQVVWLNSGGHPMTVIVLQKNNSCTVDGAQGSAVYPLECLSATNPYPKDLLEVETASSVGWPVTVYESYRRMSERGASGLTGSALEKQQVVVYVWDPYAAREGRGPPCRDSGAKSLIDKV